MVRGMGIRAKAAGQDGKGMVIRVPGGIELRSINGTKGGATDAVLFAMSMLKAASLCLDIGVSKLRSINVFVSG